MALSHAQDAVEAKIQSYHKLIGTLADVSESTAMKTLHQYRDFLKELATNTVQDDKIFRTKVKGYQDKYTLLDREIILTLSEVAFEKPPGTIRRGPSHRRDYVKFSVSEVLPALPGASQLILTADEVALLLKTALKEKEDPTPASPSLSGTNEIHEDDPHNIDGGSSSSKGKEREPDGADYLPSSALDRKDSRSLIREEEGDH